MKEAHYSIKDLEKLTGIKAHTLRIWEKRYGILQPERTPTNIRYYSDFDLKKLFNIALLNKQGFKISLLAKLSDETLNEKVVSLSQADTNDNQQLDSLLSAMVELDEIKFEKLLSKAIMNLGFEETLVKVIQPLFEKVGLLWQTGAVNSAQEHFLSNLIRQKVIVAIDGIMVNSVPNAKTFFMFLRDGEWHELGLLILAYIVKKSGHKLVYFGQSLPLDCLSEAIKSNNPDYLLTSITSSLQVTLAFDFIQELAMKFPEKGLYITGAQIKNQQVEYPDNVKIIFSIPDFKLELVSLS
ncbi:MAG: MerR family transcriptional regulator [Bacteroidota bacterium]